MVRPAGSVTSGKSASTSGRWASRPSFLNTGSKLGNVILRASVAVFCVGVALQAISRGSDPHRCGALVKHGSWPPYTAPRLNDAMDYEQLEALEKTGHESPPARSFEKWEPAGCRMHEYSREDIGYCLGGKRILFVGDSAARIAFFAALTRLDHEAAEWLLRTTFVEDNPRHDLSIESESVALDFIWDPWLNSSVFAAELSASDPQRSALFQAAGATEPPPKADLVIVGSSGLWAARNADDDYFQAFQTATDLVADSMKNTIRPFSGERESSSDDYIFLTPVTIPRYEMLPPDRAEALSPERVGRMNSYLASLPAAVQSHILSVYNEMSLYIPEAYGDTGLHVSEAVAERWIDIPLNARCNGLLAKLSADKPASLAFKATCCVAYPGVVTGQRFFLAGVFVVMLLPVVIFCLRRGSVPSSCIAASYIGLAVLLCYVADRSHLFPKAEKRYSRGWVYFSFIATGIAFLTSRRNAQVSKTEITQQPGFLSRHVSDEWKGLMQVAFLLLAYQNSTERPVPADWAEFALNSYLFLSAFGHTCYFLKTGDCSFRRVASVLFRLNILPCLLALALDGFASGTPASISHLHTSSRLVSFWFLVTCATMGLGTRRQRNRPGSLLVRVCVAAFFVAYGILVPKRYDLFEYTSQAGLYFLNSKWEAEVMRAAVSSAWCSPFVGMAIGVVSHRVAFIRSRTKLAHSLPQEGRRPKSLAAVGHSFITKDSSWVDRLVVNVMFPNEFTEPLQPMFVIFCAVFVFGYGNMISLSPPVAEEKEIYYPLSTSIAVICFAVVRNCHEKVQSIYLFFPSVLGGIALELSVLGNHIFLAGDGTGRLRLFSTSASPTDGNAFTGSISSAKVALYQTVEVVSLATVFIAVSWRCHQATRQVSAMLFGGSIRSAKTSNSHDTHDSHAADEDEEYNLPVFDDDGHSKTHSKKRSSRGWSSAWVSDGRLRAVCLLFVLWGWNRNYF